MNLLITGAWALAKENIAKLEAMGHSVQFLQFEKDVLPCEYDWVEGIIGNGLFLSHPIEKFINLRYVQLTSAGFDRVPMDYVKANGIEIYNARGVYSIPMAEFALTGVLALYKDQKFFSENQKKQIWEKKRDIKELYGQTVCILGCGSVGTECAKRFRVFGCSVLGVDMASSVSEYFDKVYAMDMMSSVIPLADIIVISLPLTDETYHMFDKSMFKLMQQDSVLVNIARGALVDTDALIESLQGKLYGAILDVFEEEPLGVESPLWQMENVIITPHNSFVGDGNSERLGRLIFTNLEGR